MYVTVDKIKAYKDIKETTDDTLLSALIDRAEDWFNRECQRTVVAEADTTRYFDAVGDHIHGNTLYVSDIGDLCAITTLTNGDGVVITSSQYTTYPKTLTLQEPTIREIKLLGSSNLSWAYPASGDWENACSLAGKWGLYQTSTVPNAVIQAIVRLTLYAYKVKDTDAFETVVIPDAGLVQAPIGFPVDVARIVRLLRNP